MKRKDLTPNLNLAIIKEELGVGCGVVMMTRGEKNKRKSKEERVLTSNEACEHIPRSQQSQQLTKGVVDRGMFCCCGRKKCRSIL